MAMYHLSVKYVSRNQGRSSVAAAAYRAGEKLHNEYDGKTYDFTRKRGIAHSEIMLPDNAPREFFDRATLWNAVEKSENRSDARTAREIEIALPNELSLDEQIALAREFVHDNFVNSGMCADIAFHSGHKSQHDQDRENDEAKDDNIILPDNPHAHILLTVRPVGKNGFTATKTAARVWNKRENVRNWRAAWARLQNREFERKGLEVRVSHESHIDRGIEREPTIHLGHEVTAMEKRGIRTELGDKNRAIIAQNKERDERERRRTRERAQSRSRDNEREQGRTRQTPPPATAQKHNRTIFEQSRREEFKPMAQSHQQSSGQTAASLSTSASPTTPSRAATPAASQVGRGQNFNKFTHTPPLPSPLENNSHNVRTDVFGFGFASEKISMADKLRQEQEELERKEREEQERREREAQEQKEREEEKERRRIERERRRQQEREENRSREAGHNRDQSKSR